ncbi:hypothetical protein niasHT_008385 [Heterodera trifolii]|uniref:DDE-1 domain-containing protein n=1 Tax=Heterodera trifolii TaxID=157864 RepID=A0ABD2LWV8_9BILA
MDAVKTVPEPSFAATATILVLVRTNAGSAQNLAMRLHHAHLHMTPKGDSAQKSHAVCAGSTATVRAAPEKATRTKHHRPLQKNTCFVMVWQNMDGQRLDDGIFGNLHFGARLLVWDSFRCHISEDTKKTLRRLALHSAVIPGGKGAPDVCWNAPFKEATRKLYNDWMAHGEKATTSGGNLMATPMEPDGAIPNGLALLKQHRQEEKIPCTQFAHLKQHNETVKHKAKLERNKGGQQQQFLTTPNNVPNQFNLDLCEAFV